MGNERAVFSGKTTVNRKDFKINFNDMVDTVPLVGDEVEIDLVIEAIRK
jgi:polyisoprenoid-binding protein YceI